MSGVIARLGATPPRSLVASNEYNPRGYWESAPLVVLHDAILKSAGSRWSDWSQFNRDWFESPVSAGFEERLEALIADEYGSSELFSVKDPRISRFLPLWLRVFDKKGIVPKAIVPIRHPEEVIQSLHQRDHFGRSKGQLLWLRHVLDAELASREVRRTFIRYEDLLADWRSAMRKAGSTLEIAWPRWSAETEAEITDFLSSELRHHRAGEFRDVEGSVLDEWMGQVHAIMTGFADGEPQDEQAFRVLDQIRSEFDRTAAIYAPVVMQHELGEERKISTMKARMQGEIEEARSKAAAAEAALVEMERRAVRAETDARNRAGRLFQQQTDRENLELKMAEQADRYRLSEADLQAKLVQYQEYRASTESRLKEYEELKSELASLRVERDGLSASLLERFRELAAIVKRMEAERREHEEAELRLGRLQREQDGLQHERDGLRHERDALRRERDGLAVAQQEISSRMAMAESKFDAERMSMGQRIDALSFELHTANSKLDGVLRSNTWKIGRPFRVARRLLTRADAKAQIAWNDDAERIRSSGTFDEQWYLSRYPDVAVLGLDPVRHYLAYGCREGRDPSPSFSTVGYYKTHPEIAARTHNALLHSLDHGD